MKYILGISERYTEIFDSDELYVLLTKGTVRLINRLVPWIDQLLFTINNYVSI